MTLQKNQNWQMKVSFSQAFFLQIHNIQISGECLNVTYILNKKIKLLIQNLRMIHFIFGFMTKYLNKHKKL